jgi:6-pyruvoyltetrahydropterin/6-carboxytetrahydropterin synthase
VFKDRINDMGKRVAVYRKEHFNAAHRLANPNWTDEQNLDVFGKCSYAHYHGHNYELIVRVVGPVNPDTGYVIDMKVLSDLIWTHALNDLDHRNLNLDCTHFSNLNPTAENIVMVIYDLLRPHIDQSFDLHLRLYETERNFVEFPTE